MRTAHQLEQLDEREFLAAYYTEVKAPTAFEQASVTLIARLIEERQDKESKISDLNKRVFYLENRNGELMRAHKLFVDEARFLQSCVKRTQTTLEAITQK